MHDSKESQFAADSLEGADGIITQSKRGNTTVMRPPGCGRAATGSAHHTFCRGSGTLGQKKQTQFQRQKQQKAFLRDTVLLDW